MKPKTKAKTAEDSAIERRGYSISEWCQAYGIGRTLFYKMRKNNKTPRITELGRRRIITNEADAEWREAMA